MISRFVARWALDVRILGLPSRQRPLPRQCWHRGASSQYNGVCRNKAKGKFEARLGFNRHQEYLGLFPTEQEAAQAYDARLRELCNDGVRLRRSLNFPTALEASFVGCQLQSRRRALSAFGLHASKEKASLDRLHRCFESSPQAENYEIIRVSGSSKVDALFQARGSLTGGLALQLKSASLRRQGFWFNNTHGYVGMLLVLVALDCDALWALPGASVTSASLYIKPGSTRDMELRTEDIGSLLESCFRNRKDFPHVSLEEARLQCSPNHQVEEQAHAFLRMLFRCVGFKLEKLFEGLATVDSVLAGGGCQWRVQEKASTIQARRYAANLSKHGGALGRRAYAETDFDLLLVALLDDSRLSGLFVFPADVLLKLGYLGRRPVTLPLYPPWRLPQQEATRAKHSWQLAHFVDLRKWDTETLLPIELRNILEDLLFRLVACQEKALSLAHVCWLLAAASA